MISIKILRLNSQQEHLEFVKQGISQTILIQKKKEKNKENQEKDIDKLHLQAHKVIRLPINKDHLDLEEVRPEIQQTKL